LERGILQLLKLIEKFVGTVKLTGFQSSRSCIFNFGGIRPVVCAWSDLSEKLPVAPRNLAQFLSELLNRNRPLTYGLEKRLQRIFVNTEGLLKIVDCLFLLFIKEPPVFCSRFDNTGQFFSWNTNVNLAVNNIPSNGDAPRAGAHLLSSAFAASDHAGENEAAQGDTNAAAPPATEVH